MPFAFLQDEKLAKGNDLAPHVEAGAWGQPIFFFFSYCNEMRISLEKKRGVGTGFG
jgi:hypothetical protein